jgi:uncharacterized membrane protein (DUF373 family)
MIDKFYFRFERAIAGLLTVGMCVGVLFATAWFAIGLFETVLQVDSGLDYLTFQALFERVLAAVIALELARSVQQMAAGRHGLAQVRTVALIGVLAVVRKLIVIDIESTSGMFLLGLAAAVLALGAVYAMTLYTARLEPPQ